MKYINLITTKNSFLRKSFDDLGFEIIEHRHVPDIEYCKSQIKGAGGSITILELTDAFVSDNNKASELLLNLGSKTKLICLTEKLNQRARELLTANGISDLLVNTDMGRLKKYIKYISTPEQGNSWGRILILDDVKENRQILKAVTTRLDYSPDFITKDDDLFTHIKSNQVQLILINLGTKNLDMNKIIRKTYTDNEIRKFPIIAYKNMDEGMFVHEFLNGLNKLTKVVLSPEELYSSILDLLYKKRIMTLASEFNTTINFDKYSTYSNESISQIYYEIHRDLCDQETIFRSDQLDTLLELLEEIKRIIISIDGLRWLKPEKKTSPMVTCGLGAGGSHFPS